MADTINTTEATHETKKPNAFVNFFKNNLTDKRYDALGLIGAGGFMLCLERCYGDCWDNLCCNRNLFVFF